MIMSDCLSRFRRSASARRRQSFACCIWVIVAALGMMSAVLAADQPATPAAEAIAPGHSYHGETFDDGPRQRATLTGNTGAVKFPATTQNAQAQEFINQGVGQLHGFWYYEAERSFRQAAQLDPQCAIAYWGMAQANINNEKRARGFIAEAVKRKAGITERENLYIDALDAYYKADPKDEKKDEKKDKGQDRERHEAYAKALERILYKFPDDLEAKALLCLQLWLNRNHDSNITSHLAVDALLKEVLAVEPMHPCHHYRIHLWDYEKAERALDSAAKCGQSAPAIAHMWHMSGHIYSRVERYADAAWQQEASARVDHAYMMRDRIFPDQIHNYAHNNEWLIRDLAHVGRVRDAIDLAKNLCDLPRHPKYNTLENGKSAHFGRLRLFEELSRFEMWSELIALSGTSYLEPTDDPAEQVKRLRYLGAALFRSGDVARGRMQIAELERRLARESNFPIGAELRPAAVPAPSMENGKSAPRSDAEKKRESRLRPLELALDELHGHWAAARGDARVAARLLRKAGGVDPLYRAKLEWQGGEKDEALKSAQSTVKTKKNQVQPLAGLIELLWEAGRKTEAGEKFAELRTLGERADLDVPPLARLAPIALELGYPADWRLAGPPPTDVGQRPALDSLGPFKWSPVPAPEWRLVDSFGQEYVLSQYRGRPLVLIFYLGSQCLHCAEQLQKFAPMTDAYREAGITLLAVSTDDREGLRKSLVNYKGGDFPFPLVSDASLEVFKAYRAFDDFENRPLHGTFFIDGSGFVRWHDISAEPFQDPKYLLDEARRLLSLPTDR
jgi:peroxiredoxin/tetratricopeptide (TPR) repeat protein